MDNDLMARRLRPPSEPTRPQNGHSPVPPDAAPWDAAPEPTNQIPWDRPAQEPWPPLEAEAQAAADQWPPLAEPATSVTGDEAIVQTDEVATDEAVHAPDFVLNQHMWDAGPAEEAAPWHASVEVDPAAASEAEPESADVDAPAPSSAVVVDTTAPVESVAEVDDDATDISVPGQAPWDTPESRGWAEQETPDDRPSEMLASYDEMIPMVSRAVAAASVTNVEDEPAAAVADAAVPDAAVSAAAETAEPSVTAEETPDVESPAMQDPEDAFAPVLGDVQESATLGWTTWMESRSIAGRTVVQPDAVPGAFGPTPPDDLFAETEPAMDEAAETTAAAADTDDGDAAAVAETPAVDAEADAPEAAATAVAWGDEMHAETPAVDATVDLDSIPAFDMSAVADDTDDADAAAVAETPTVDAEADAPEAAATAVAWGDEMHAETPAVDATVDLDSIPAFDMSAVADDTDDAMPQRSPRRRPSTPKLTLLRQLRPPSPGAMRCTPRRRPSTQRSTSTQSRLST